MVLEYHAAYYQGEDGWYVAEVLDFPGVATQGKTLNAARRMLRSALEEMAEWLLTDGEPLPQPKAKKAAKAVQVEPIQLVIKARTGAAP